MECYTRVAEVPAGGRLALSRAYSGCQLSGAGHGSVSLGVQVVHNANGVCTGPPADPHPSLKFIIVFWYFPRSGERGSQPVPHTNTRARCTGDDEAPLRPGTRPVGAAQLAVKDTSTIGPSYFKPSDVRFNPHIAVPTLGTPEQLSRLAKIALLWRPLYVQEPQRAQRNRNGVRNRSGFAHEATGVRKLAEHPV